MVEFLRIAFWLLLGLKFHESNSTRPGNTRNSVCFKCLYKPMRTIFHFHESTTVVRLTLIYSTDGIRDYFPKNGSVQCGEFADLCPFPPNVSFVKKTTCMTFE